MKTIYTTKGERILVDDDDYEDLSKHKWFVNGSGYAVRSEYSTGKCRTLIMHRLIVGLGFGDVLQVDHINGERLDNRRENLRICTSHQNSLNKRRESRNTSGFKGVSRRKNADKWMAQIKVNRKNRILGHFDTPEEAHAAYCKAAKELHGDFSNDGKEKAFAAV